MDKLLLIVFVLGFVASGIVWLVNKYSVHSFFKYIPCIVLYILACAAYIKGNWFSVSMEDLGYKAMGIMLLGIGVMAQMSAFLISLSKIYHKKD
ncbi:MAG: hypothetical protein ACOWWR_16800 [Eubacteriales bacterium]